MRILCISAQKPDSTGSGVYLAETVASMAAAGHQVAVIAGIDKDDSPQLAPRRRVPSGALPHPRAAVSRVRHERRHALRGHAIPRYDA